jgi:glycosyltransferase involved in cell wall biosynthesis
VNSALPRVWIIVPNYNHARFLRKRLRSIFGQTCQDFEVIYLDDCSTDNSEEIVAEFGSDGRIRCFRNARNSGSPFIQINKGVRLARGELIWIAEADDYVDPEFLESLVPVLSGNPLVGLVYCRSMVIDEEDKVITSIGNCGKYLRWASVGSAILSETACKNAENF